MKYPLACAWLVLVAGCGDDQRAATPDAGGEPDGGAAVCLGGRTPADLAAGAWDARFGVAGVGGHDGIPPAVFDFARAPDGSIVAAGRFDWWSGAPAAPLLRWRGGAWEPARTTWELPPPVTGFSSIAIAAGGDLALATSDDFGARSSEIWLDDGSGLRVIGTVNGQVRRMVWFDGDLWVGGLFTLGDGPGAITHLAVWNGTAWAAAPGGNSDDAVYALALDGTGVLAGGAFRSIGGITAHKAARWSGTQWTGFDLPGGLAVFALARDAGGTLLAGGSLADLDGSVATGGLMRWSGSAWEVVGGGLATRNLPGVVSDLVVHDGVVDVVGCFMTAGGAFESKGSVAALDAARWNGTDWQALDDGSAPVFAPWFLPRQCGDEGPQAIWDATYQRLATDGSNLLVGGLMAGTGNVQSQGLIVHDGTGFVAQGTGGAGLGGSLDRIAASPDGCEVYGYGGFGSFTHVAGAPSRAHVLRFAGDQWEPIADTLDPSSFCPTLAVARGGEASLGCLDGVYRVTGNTLSRVPVDLPGMVMHLFYDPSGALWIGGATESGGGFLARLDGAALTVVDTSLDGAVMRIDARSATDVVAGGGFTNHIAHWDGTRWSPLGDGVPGQVMAVARDGSTVYTSTYDEGTGAFLLGAFDGTTWRELATPTSGMTARPDLLIEQILPLDGTLVLGGTIALDDAAGRGVLLYRDGTFHALGGGVGAISIGGVAATADALWVAGWIAEAGTGPTRVSSVGVARWIRATDQ